MKRNYLKVPGQTVTINIAGASGVEKEALVQKIAEALLQDGLEVGVHPGFSHGSNHVESLTARCMTPAEERTKYLETLGEHEIATLRGHLDALGYEL